MSITCKPHGNHLQLTRQSSHMPLPCKKNMWPRGAACPPGTAFGTSQYSGCGSASPGQPNFTTFMQPISSAAKAMWLGRP